MFITLGPTAKHRQHVTKSIDATETSLKKGGVGSLPSCVLYTLTHKQIETEKKQFLG